MYCLFLVRYRAPLFKKEEQLCTDILLLYNEHKHRSSSVILCPSAMHTHWQLKSAAENSPKQYTIFSRLSKICLLENINLWPIFKYLGMNGLGPQSR